MISFKEVEVRSLTGRTLFQKTSFETKPGTIIGLFGPNGAGKSTLLKTISGQTRDRLVSGENWVSQLPIFQNVVSAAEKARKILYLGSDFQTSFQVSVRELLIMAREANPASGMNVSEVSENFGITALLSRFFNELSDGEKQKVMIARGVVQNPQWLILDETFSKIDLDQSQLLIQELKKRVEKGLGVFMASHDLNLLTEIADELWLIKDGKIEVSGPIEEALNLANLQKLFPNRVLHVVRNPESGRKKVIY